MCTDDHFITTFPISKELPVKPKEEPGPVIVFLSSVFDTLASFTNSWASF